MSELRNTRLAGLATPTSIPQGQQLGNVNGNQLSALALQPTNQAAGFSFAAAGA